MSDDPQRTAEPVKAESIEDRLAEYKLFQEKVLYVSGGVGGILIFGGLADKMSVHAPAALSAWFLAAAILSGTFLALARISWDNAANRLRKLGSSAFKEVVPSGSFYERPKRAVTFLTLGSAMLFAAACLIVARSFVAAYWPTTTEMHCSVEWQNGAISATATCTSKDWP
jgi:hypothetical protein